MWESQEGETILSFIDNKLIELLNIDFGANNAGQKGEDYKKYYNYKAEYKFIKGDNESYYDLKLITKVKKYDDKINNIVPIDITEIYTFRNNKYVKK